MGYAVGREELEPGLVAVAAPVRGLNGRVEGAVSVSGPSFRMTSMALPEYTAHVTAAAAAISGALGHPIAQAMVG